MILPGELDITIYQAVDFDLPFVWMVDNVPMDVSGGSAELHIRKEPEDTLVFRMATDNGRITLGDTNGLVTLIASSAATTDIPAGRYVYDLVVTLGTKKYRALMGKVTVSAGVTK